MSDLDEAISYSSRVFYVLGAVSLKCSLHCCGASPIEYLKCHDVDRGWNLVVGGTG